MGATSNGTKNNGTNGTKNNGTNGTKTNGTKNNGTNANNNENPAVVTVKKHMDKLEPKSEIIKFFSGRNVFITGGSGYLGRVLIFKLLTYCPGIGKVYLLMRKKGQYDKDSGKKKEKGPAERLSEMKDHFLFRAVDETLPGQLDKLRIVEGDCQEAGMAMSEEDRSELTRETNVVFHVAATVRFEEKLSKSIKINVRGTKEMMELAREMEGLESFVHVSTAYAHCHLVNEVIQEKVYPPEMHSTEEVLGMSENVDVDEAAVTKLLIGERPNTYTFTKAHAEQLINEKRGELPIAIVRPSIVAGAIEEPMPGWVDNLNGPMGLVASGAHGMCRALNADSDAICDIIPVDTVINMMCAVAYRTAGQYDRKAGKRPGEIPVYNCNSGTKNPATWGEFHDLLLGACYKFPMENIIFPPDCLFHMNKMLTQVMGFFLHWVPAYAIDAAVRLFGGKPFLVKIVTKVDAGIKTLEYFTSREWIWANDNSVALEGELNGTDRECFDFSLRNLHWQEFFDNYFLVGRHYVCKYKPESIEACKKRLGRMVLAFNVVKWMIALAPAIFLAYAFNLI